MENIANLRPNLILQQGLKELFEVICERIGLKLGQIIH